MELESVERATAASVERATTAEESDVADGLLYETISNRPHDESDGTEYDDVDEEELPLAIETLMHQRDIDHTYVRRVASINPALVIAAANNVDSLPTYEYEVPEGALQKQQRFARRLCDGRCIVSPAWYLHVFNKLPATAGVLGCSCFKGFRNYACVPCGRWMRCQHNALICRFKKCGNCAIRDAFPPDTVTLAQLYLIFFPQTGLLHPEWHFFANSIRTARALFGGGHFCVARSGQFDGAGGWMPIPTQHNLNSVPPGYAMY